MFLVFFILLILINFLIKKLCLIDFEQISIKPGFMKHNGGLLFRKIAESEFEFKTTIKENHLNTAGITHGGYISSIIDSQAQELEHIELLISSFVCYYFFRYQIYW